jgi:hypothetical protein
MDEKVRYIGLKVHNQMVLISCFSALIGASNRPLSKGVLAIRPAI